MNNRGSIEKRWKQTHSRLRRTCYIQVCQIRVMTEFETIVLTQDGANDFRTMTVFLFPKFIR